MATNILFMAKSLPKLYLLVTSNTEEAFAPFDVNWILHLYFYSFIAIFVPSTILFFFHPLSGGDTRIHPLALAVGLIAATWAAFRIVNRYVKH
jgi:hypothetical protein